MTDLIDKQALMEKVRCRKNCDCANCDFYTDGDSWCDGEVYGTTIMQMPTIEPKKGKWISVEDALPTDDTVCLVRLNSYGEACRHAAVDTDRISMNGHWARWQNYVTHWMPLPDWMI